MYMTWTIWLDENHECELYGWTDLNYMTGPRLDWYDWQNAWQDKTYMNDTDIWTGLDLYDGHEWQEHTNMIDLTCLTGTYEYDRTDINDRDIWTRGQDRVDWSDKNWKDMT